MGYYSDVCLVLNEKGNAVLKKQLAAPSLDDKVRSEVNNLLQCADKHLVDDKTKSECWFWGGIKWYTCDPKYFPEINFLDNLMILLPEEDYYFLRIGEETDDSEICGMFWDNPFETMLAREIVIDC